MRRIFLLVCLLLLGAGERLPSHQIRSMGRDWTYYTAVPVGHRHNLSKKLPLVLLFHGTGGNGGGFLQRSGWLDKARQSGALVVAPSALTQKLDQSPDFLSNPRLWNVGQSRLSDDRRYIDDVRFVLDLLIDVQTHYAVDPQRIYLVGHSNGASFSAQLANKFPDKFAGLGLVMGTVTSPLVASKRSLPSYFVFGDQDPILPVAGGLVETPWGPFNMPGLETMVAGWSRAHGGTGEPKLVSEDDHQRTFDYGGQVRATYIRNQGHNYPGLEQPMAEELFGPTNMAVSATDLIWEFFQPPAP